MQPNSQPSSWMTTFARSTRLRLAGGLGFGLVLLGFHIRNLCAKIGVEEYRYSTGEFTNSPGGQLIGWTDETVTPPSGGQPVARSQVEVVEKLAADDRAVFDVAEQVLSAGDDLAKRNARGAMHYGDGGGHRYAFHTSSVEVPEPMRPAFEAPDNHNVFRGLMSCFPPFAWQIPTNVPHHDFLIDETGFAMTTDTRDEAIEHYNQEQWKLNALVTDHISLGANGNIAFSHSRRIVDPTRGLIVWLALASTLASHPLDGRALWGLGYSTRTKRMAMFQVGAGEHRIPPVDWLNPYVAGFVFGTMFHTYAALLRTATTPELPSLLGPDRSQRLFLAYRHYPELLRWRLTGAELDTYAFFGALAREVTGGNVIAPPTPSSTPVPVPPQNPTPESRITQL